MWPDGPTYAVACTIDELRRQALDADRRPGVRGLRPRIEAHAGNDVPPPADRSPKEDLRFGGIEDAVNRLALGSHEDAIAIAADPRSAVPAKSGLAVHDLRLELIEQHLVADRAIVNGVAAVIDVLRERGATVSAPAGTP